MKRSIVTLFAVLIFVGVGIASAPKLTFTFSDVKANKTASETDSYAVNNTGVITGDYVDSAGVQHPMDLAGKKLTTFDYGKCTALTGTGGPAAYGINSKGVSAGWCTNSKGIDIGWTWAPGIFVDINFPKGTGTQANGINDKGDVVGSYADSAGVVHGFLYSKKKYTKIDVKGASATAAYSINNAGVITLYTGGASAAGVACSTTTPCAGYLLSGKKLTKLAPPKAGPIGVVAHAVNNKGDVDGTYFDTAGGGVGFLLHGGTYYDVKDPKASNSTRADGLNDKLEMVGRYTPATGGNFGFKATTK